MSNDKPRTITRKAADKPARKPEKRSPSRPPAATTSKPRKRYRLALEYDGTGFSGWQKQDDARTVQGSLLAAATELFGDRTLEIQGNGRTDAGVHALHYTAHLETANATLAPGEIHSRLNERLPASIAVLEVSPCHPRFHARHNCVGRSYLYQISRRKNAFQKKYLWWVKERLDAKAMAEAARLFAGMHDFAAFAEKQELKKSTLVMLNGVYLYDDGEMLRLRVVGSHFLWKMVRRLTAVLVEVGRGNLGTRETRDYLEGHSEVPAKLTAPAAGLFFERAFYDPGEFEDFLAEAGEEAI